MISCVIPLLVLLSCSNMGQEKGMPEVEDPAVEVEISSGETPGEYRTLVFYADEEPDVILETYRDETFTGKVVGFFGNIIHSEELAAVILKEASGYNVSPSIAFALGWEESRFDKQAVNKNRNNTTDRGLFQLNSSSFPNLKEADFFDPGTNARHAMAHLRWCLDNADSELAALAMYNAGLNRVKTGGTPKKTLDYVSRILKSAGNIDSLFAEERTKWIIAEAEKNTVIETKPAVFIPVDSLALAWAGILSTRP